MHEEAVVLLAKKLRASGKIYAEVGSIFGLSLFSARKLCTHEICVSRKRGHKFTIMKKTQIAITRKVKHLRDSGQKVVRSKIVYIYTARQKK